MRFGAKVNDYVDARDKLILMLQELEQRMSLFPVDVRDKLNELCAPAKLLGFLQDEGINGSAPPELIDKVRSL